MPENKKDIEVISAMMKAYDDNAEYNKSLNLVSLHQGRLIIDDLNKPENSHILNNSYVQSAIITIVFLHDGLLLLFNV